MARSPLWDNPAFIEACLTKRKKDVMEEWGVSSGLVVDVKKAHGGNVDASRSIAPGDSETHRPDGSADYTISSTVAWGYEDFRKFIEAKGQNPDDVTFSWGVTSNPGGGFWNKLQNVRPKKAKDAAPAASHDEVMSAIRNFHFLPSERAYQDRGFVLVPTDLQTGKVDLNLGTAETVAQVLNSFSRAAEIIEEERPREVAMVDAGDIIENQWNTSSQLATNDRDLPHQIVEAMYLMQRGIQMLAPHCESLRYAAVSSNHGAARSGFKQSAGDAHADYGLAIAKMLGHALKLNPQAFGHVTVQTPPPLIESLAFDIAGTRIGVVHGHQASSPDKIADWWRGQALNRNLPTANADYLITGHWHSLRVQQAGDERYIFVGPSSDRGSSWFTNIKGDVSTSGMLSFFTADKQWSDLRIL